MLSVAEYAEKVGCTPRTVSSWCSKGLMQGAVKKRGSGYQIPENAPVPKRKQGRPFVQCNQTASAEPTGKTYTQQEMCDFIVHNCTRMTYGKISRELNIPAAEVRRIYDHLHEAYGV